VRVDVILFFGRILLLLGLYGFISAIVWVIFHDLRRHTEVLDAPAPGEIVVVDPGQSGLKPNDAFPLLVETYIGRLPDNAIQLQDSTVSGRHARMVHRKGLWTIEDLGSRNGLFVEGAQTNRRTPLRYGDIIQIGNIRLKLVKE
jgi:hypothetical protein